MTRRDPKAMAAEAFARTLVEALADGHQQQAFKRLVLVAGPHMLGDLRAALTPELRACILAEIDKDLTNVATRDLARHLDDALAP